MSEAVERISLDVHAHQAPIFPDQLKSVSGVTWNAAAKVLVIDGHEVGMNALFDPEQLIAWMDRNGVERAWISIPPPLYRPQLRGAAARAWAIYVNSGLQRIAERHPGRLSPLPHLPLGSPDIATEVAQGWIGRGHCRFGAPAGGNGEQVLSDPVFHALWRMLDAAHAFIFFHPGECADGRLKAFYLSNLLGNPYETSVAIAHLVFGGVIERHSNITFCFAHGGGALPMQAGRLERGFATDRPGIDKHGKPPRMLLRNLCVDCITHDPYAIELAEHVFGPSQVVFGSDWPFPMGLVQPHQQMQTLDPQRRRRIFCDNPDRLMAKHPNGVTSRAQDKARSVK